MDEKIIVVKQSGFGLFLRGVLIGAAAGLLLAPRSGKETRAMISEKSTEIRDKAYDIAQDTRQRAENVIHDAKGRITGRIKSNKDNLDETVEELKREVSIMEDVNNPVFPL